MGTNYYVQRPPCDNACEHCAQAARIHIGKSSAGWKFLHRAYLGDEYQRPDTVPFEVRDRESWLRLLDLGQLFDEYDRLIDRPTLLALIEAKQADAVKSHNSPDDMGPYWQPSENDFADNGYDFCALEFS